MPLLLSGVRITLLEANHCPGAAMILAEPPHGPPVLHTGDCRVDGPLTASLAPLLTSMVGRCTLVLDTTYCDPAYCFPPQADVLAFVLDVFRSEAFNPRTLYLFGRCEVRSAFGCLAYGKHG